MVQRLIIIFTIALGLAWACKPLDERADPNPAKALRFSADTVQFDTVFTEQKTITLRVRVYNDNAGMVTLESVSLALGGTSPYSITINGRPGPAQNLEILGKDSAYVLVSGKLNPSRVDTPLVIEDKILFRVKGRPDVQQVLVLAKGQDAYFLGTGASDELLVLGSSTTFTPEKPIVLFSSLLVDINQTLTIQAGSRIHLYKDAYLIVKGRLLVNGTCDRPVRFMGTRLEPYYKYVPGQWGYIGFIKPSQGNRINYAIIENGLRGVQVDIPSTNLDSIIDLRITNTMIRNVSDVGLWGFGADITAYNLVVADCGSSYIAGQRGGTYNFAHCTLAQSGNTPYNRKNPLMLFTDFYQQDNSTPAIVSPTPPVVGVYNCLLSGTLNEELVLGKPTGTNAPIDTSEIDNNLLSGKRTLALPKTNRWQQRTQNFELPSNYDFRPDSAAPGIATTGTLRVGAVGDKAAFRILRNSLYVDFLCKNRDTESPAAGAYEKKQ